VSELWQRCRNLASQAFQSVHRLVIVEGIIGSGKSTTMRFTAKHLQEAERKAVHIHEMTNTPPRVPWSKRRWRNGPHTWRERRSNLCQTSAFR